MTLKLYATKTARRVQKCTHEQRWEKTDPKSLHIKRPADRKNRWFVGLLDCSLVDRNVHWSVRLSLGPSHCPLAQYTVRWSVALSVCPLDCTLVCQTVCWSARLSVGPSDCSLACWAVRWSVGLSAGLSVDPSD